MQLDEPNEPGDDVTCEWFAGDEQGTQIFMSTCRNELLPQMTGAAVVGALVVGAGVVGATVVGAGVVGALVVGVIVVVSPVDRKTKCKVDSFWML